MLLPSMGKGLGLAYDQMGFISTGNFVGYLGAVAIAPFFVARIGSRVTIAFGLTLISVCMLLIGWGTEYREILLLYLVTGVGSGLANVPMMVLVSHWFSRSARGRAAGMIIAGNGVAIIFAGYLVPVLGQTLGEAGWRAGWKVFGAISLITAIIAALLLRNSPENMGISPMGEVNEEERENNKQADKVPARGILTHLGVLYFFFGATYVIYGTFIVTTMVSERGIAEAAAGRFWSVVGFFSIFSGPLFGALSDRIGRKGGLMAVFAVHTLTYLLAGLKLGAWALYLSVALYGISAWSIPTIMAAAVADYLGLARAAGAFSVITFFFAAGQALGPGVAGVVAKGSGSFSGSYLMAAAATGLAFFIALFLRKPASDT